MSYPAVCEPVGWYGRTCIAVYLRPYNADRGSGSEKMDRIRNTGLKTFVCRGSDIRLPFAQGRIDCVLALFHPTEGFISGREKGRIQPGRPLFLCSSRLLLLYSGNQIATEYDQSPTCRLPIGEMELTKALRLAGLISRL